MKRTVLIDTGPLVAFLNGKDMHHKWVVEQLKQITPPLLTCEAVIAEACWLLRMTPAGIDNIMELFQREVLSISFPFQLETENIRRIMKKYHDLPTSLADACLVRMAEIHDNSTVLTLDSDFRVYRKSNRRTIPVLMPNRKNM
ncbi:MAG: PIN domain-containing protein [Verrucomicrobiae bacterium]|nr:PIN domain-containing protein [Verrucomicrobiae bacterium]